MARSDDLHRLPAGLPVPGDDGAAKHLPHAMVPPIALPSTRGREVVLAEESQERRVVVYAYPRTGRPDQELPPGWDAIPGARGCTPQSCGFRDAHAELARLAAAVYGLSTQTTEYQREMAQRLHLPFEILSDAEFKFCDALRLPTFEASGTRLVKRACLLSRIPAERERRSSPSLARDLSAMIEQRNRSLLKAISWRATG